MRTMERSVMNKKIGGVCAGIAKYLQVDVTIIRVAFIVGAFAWGLCLLLYIILWVVMPEEKVDYSAYFGAASDTPQQEPAGQDFFSQQINVENPFSEKKSTNLSMTAGIIMIIFGTIMLISNFVPFLDFSDLFPVIFVAIGGIMIFNALQKRAKSGGEL